MSAPPVFIVGCPRSGTTLLRLMLNAHPDVAIPPESHFVPLLWAVRRRYATREGIDSERMTRDIVATKRYADWNLPEEVVWQRVRTLRPSTFGAVITTIFEAYAEHWGKSRWGDKTPSYSLELPLLSRVFPEARFVHVIRDGRNVALSIAAVSRARLAIPAAMRAWAHRVRKAREDGRRLGPHRYREVTYERLTAETESTLRELCSFVELDFATTMVAYADTAAAFLPQRTHRYQANLTSPPTAGVRDWRVEMSRDELAVVEAIGRRELVELGYELAVRPVPIGARVAAGAGAIADRAGRAAWAARRSLASLSHPRALPPPRRW